MSKKEDDEEEESRRRFLLEALFIVGDGDKKEGLKLEGQCTTKVSSTNSVRSSRDKPNDRREHGRGRNYTEVTRITQLDTWDCGIACLLMIALWLRDGGEYESESQRFDVKEGNDREDPYAIRDDGDDGDDCRDARLLSERRKVVSEVETESIWTSDLMRQLQSWKTKRTAPSNAEPEPWSSSSSRAARTIPGIESEDGIVFVLASQQVVGADESYRDFQYYQNAFEEDQSRVARTFCDLHRQNVPMLRTTVFRDGLRGRGLSLSTVIDIVERDDCLAILLLDNCVLLGTAENPASPPIPAPTAGHRDGGGSSGGETTRPPYAGHYVILCGTSDNPKHIEIANSGETRSWGGSKQGDEEDANGFCFVVCNPDPLFTLSGANYMFVTPDRLKASWKAQGTDEDIIIYENSNSRSQPQSHKTLDACCNNNADDGGGNEQRKGDDCRFSARIQIIVRENYDVLIQVFWTLYKDHFPPFRRK